MDITKMEKEEIKRKNNTLESYETAKQVAKILIAQLFSRIITIEEFQKTFTSVEKFICWYEVSNNLPNSFATEGDELHDLLKAITPPDDFKALNENAILPREEMRNLILKKEKEKMEASKMEASKMEKQGIVEKEKEEEHNQEHLDAMVAMAETIAETMAEDEDDEDK
jgi:CHASE3 domain sensor protein